MSSSPLRPLRPEAFDYWAAQHLLARAGFGGTPEQVRALTDMGLERAVDYIIDYKDVPYEAIRAETFANDIIRPLNAEERERFATARRNNDEVTLGEFQRMRNMARGTDRRQMREIQGWWMKRLIETPRPLEEKMTLFWHGHFASGFRKVEDSYHMFLQNQTLRAHATGNFRDMTKAIIRDPAMIAYLDNNRNVRSSPNENLARELMELFTMGEGNGYTEEDIKEGARALTGYTYIDDDFILRRQLHDNGTKRIFKKSGRFNGEDFVDLIMSHNVVSQFITHKIYRFFVNDEPGDPTDEGQSFVIALAKQFRSRYGYEIRPLLRTLFMSEHFYADANRASMIKSPLQLIVQSIRSLRTPTRSVATLLAAADLMGQNLFFPPSVKGWPGGRTWINTSTLFVRQNTLVFLLTGRRPDAHPWDSDDNAFDAMHLIDHVPHEGARYDVEAASRSLLRFCLGRAPSDAHVKTLVDFVTKNGGELHNDMLIGMLTLITAMPEYQLC